MKFVPTDYSKRVEGRTRPSIRGRNSGSPIPDGESPPRYGPDRKGGRQDRIFNDPAFTSAIKGASEQFQRAIKPRPRFPGKGG